MFRLGFTNASFTILSMEKQNNHVSVRPPEGMGKQ